MVTRAPLCAPHHPPGSPGAASSRSKPEQGQGCLTPWPSQGAHHIRGSEVFSGVIRNTKGRAWQLERGCGTVTSMTGIWSTKIIYGHSLSFMFQQQVSKRGGMSCWVGVFLIVVLGFFFRFFVFFYCGFIYFFYNFLRQLKGNYGTESACGICSI